MYKYTHFIPENIAPKGTQKIGVYNASGQRVLEIPLGNLAPPTATPLYKFCALADIHLTYNTANADFENALKYAEDNCNFTCIAGDLTSTGADESQMALYKSIVDANSSTKPVYAITGNHENYFSPFLNKHYSDQYLEKYTGYPLYYTVSNKPTDTTKKNYYNATLGENDVFVMVGHYGAYAGDGVGWLATETWSKEELQWLYETLEENRNKRCFVFTHVLPHEHGVGNPNNLYVTSGKPRLWYTNDGGIGQAFMSLLKHYKNTILFHGHSHTRFWLQELDEKANYSSTNGYRSVHIPSLAVPRDPNGANLSDMYAESEGYIVDVYDKYIVLNGRDFIDNNKDGHDIPIAQYRIDTTLQGIPAGTFTDPTGVIQT